MENLPPLGLSKNWFYALIGLSVLLLIPIWLFQYLPLNDWPNHLASMSMLARNDAGLSSYVQANPNLLLPNSTAFWFMRLAGPMVGIETSGRLLLSLTVLLTIWGSAYFMRSIDERLTALGGALGAGLAFNWFFLMGFLNFALSIPLFLITAGYWMKNREDAGGKEQIIIFTLAILTALTHLIAGLVLMGLVVAFRGWALIRQIKDKKWSGLKKTLEKKLAVDLWVVIPCLAVASLSLIEFSPQEQTSAAMTVWGHPITKLAYLFVTPPNPGLWLMAGLVLSIYLFLMIRRESVSWRPDKFWLLLMLGVGTIGLLAPENTATWQFAAPRAWPFFIFFAFAAVFKPLCQEEKDRSLIRDITIALVIITLAQTAIIFIDWQNMQSPIQAVVSADSVMRAGAAVLPIGSGFAASGTEVGVSPFFHAWGYWTVQKQIYTPYMFAWDYSPVQMRNGTAYGRVEINDWMERLAFKGFSKPTNESCKYWKEYYQEFNWTLVADNYDYVALRTDKCENESIVPQPFAKVYENGTIFIFENERKK